ncbi:MAG: hypothetical protein WCF57_10860 [Pyrinomonadaceae bacterium]
MQETKDPKSNETTAGGASQGEDSEATSSDTLSDVEEKEKVSDAGHEGETSSAPSPDGAFDESRERDDAGPM